MTLIRSFLFVLSLSIVSINANAEEVLHLKNGDRLSGEVMSYSGGTVSIKTGYGVFNVPISDLTGVLPKKVEAAVEEKAAVAKVAKDKSVSEVAVASPGKSEKDKMLWGAKWSGKANFGAGLKTGNSEKSNVNADASLKARWDKHRLNFKTDFNYEKDDGEESVDNRSFDLRHDYFFTDKWFFNDGIRFEQDEIDRLDLRTIVSAGIGFQPYEGDALNVKYGLGFGYMTEEFEDDSGEDTMITEWALDYDQKFFDDLFRLFHEHDFSAPLDDFNAYLFQSESGIRLPLKLGVIASGQVDFDWDNDPAEGTKEEDVTYSVKLGYEW